MSETRYTDTMARFKIVALFLVAWLMAQIIWSFLLRNTLPHHADKAPVQGLAGLT